MFSRYHHHVQYCCRLQLKSTPQTQAPKPRHDSFKTREPVREDSTKVSRVSTAEPIQVCSRRASRNPYTTGTGASDRVVSGPARVEWGHETQTDFLHAVRLCELRVRWNISQNNNCRMKNLNGVNNLHPSPQQSSSPHLQPQQQPASQQMQTRPQPESQPTQLESQQPSSSLIATAAVVGSELPRIPSEPALSREASAQIVTPIALSQRTIAQDHVEMLRTLANSIGNTSGKWDSVHAAFKSLYPNMPLSVNALRCRLKERKATSKSLQHSEVSAQPKTRKRRETSCDSCRKRKKRCGDLAANPYFCVLLSAFHQHVSIVLARLNAASSAPLLAAASAAAPTRRRPPHPAYLSCALRCMCLTCPLSFSFAALF